MDAAGGPIFTIMMFYAETLICDEDNSLRRERSSSRVY